MEVRQPEIRAVCPDDPTLAENSTEPGVRSGHPAEALGACGNGWPLSQAPQPTGAQCSREFQGWGRARVFLWVGKSVTPALGSCSSWSPLEGTVRENSRRRKHQMEPLGSNSESRTVGLVCLLSPHWKDGALETMARAPSSGWGLREKGNLSTPGQGMRGGMSLEAQVRNSVREETAREREARDRPLVTASPLTSPASAIPALRELSSGSNWGAPGPHAWYRRVQGWWRECWGQR